MTIIPLLARLRPYANRLYQRYKRLALNILFALISLVLTAALLEFVAGRWNAAHTPPIVLPPNSTFEYEQAEFSFSVETNSLGFRGPEVALQPSPERCRIVVIGDSFTYGAGLDFDQTWPHLLETQLQHQGLDVEVLNLGKSGAGPAEYVIAAERATVLQPDLVVVLPLQLDDLLVADAVVDYARIEYISPAWDFLPSRWLGKTLPEIHSLTYRIPRHIDAATYIANRRDSAQELIASASPEKQARYEALDPEVRAYFEAGMLSPSQINRALERPDAFTRLFEDEDYLQQQIDGLADKLTIIQALYDPEPVMLVSMPYRTSIDAATLEGLNRLGYDVIPDMYESDLADDSLRRAGAQADMPFTSVITAFRTYHGEQPLFYPLDGHLTPQGSQLFADAVMDGLQIPIMQACATP